jgi:basic amino acid/polyamine antiporter, APA family
MPSLPNNQDSPHELQRRLGLFDATMLVMGGIIGSGIFMNPAVVARSVHTPLLILGAWIVGGFVALAGGFIYAELSSRLPNVGGQYAYLREAWHPRLAFLNGWALLLVTQTGGMAAVAVTFARYFLELTHLPVSETIVASSSLAALTLVNCFGVRAGGTIQNILMILKIGAITLLIIAGVMFAGLTRLFPLMPPVDAGSPNVLVAFGAAMIPVVFAYGGWQTACFVAGEIRDPRKNLPRALLLGTAGVVILYLAVNIVCVGVLGADGLAATTTPASDVMRRALGEAGATAIALGIAVSTLGFLSQGILTAPRVYYAMAHDGLFFRSVARVNPVTRVPVTAIVIQGIWAIIIACSGKYEQILSYVVSTDFIFFGLSATSLFVFRKRLNSPEGVFRMPGHPVITILFIAVCWLVVISTIYASPINSIIGIGIVISGIPVYAFWKRGSTK